MALAPLASYGVTPTPDTPIPATPELNSNQILGQSLSFSWQESIHADSYDFYLYDRTLATIVFRDFSVPSSACSSGICTYQTPDSIQLPIGSNHLWQVAASNQSGKSNFSYSLFNIVDLKPSIKSSYTLVFESEFNDHILDPAIWNTSLLWGPYHSINNEQQLYVDTLGSHIDPAYSPFTLTGDTLRITATPISVDAPYPPLPDTDSPLWQPNSYSEYIKPPCIASLPDDPTSCDDVGHSTDFLSGIITSYGSFNLTHGYVEMRAKLPAGQGLWPAFWLLPQHYVKDVPEIDVMEFLGHDIETLYHTYHYFDIDDENVWTAVSTDSMTTLSTDWTADFHTFGMAWSPTEIVWYVDDQETRRITDSEFLIANQPMHLLANLAVGGNWPGAADKTDTSVFPAVFEIDYIRAYKKSLSHDLDIGNDYQLMFEDNFTGNSLDPEKWNTHFLWGPYLPINNEKQYYVDALGSDAGGLSPFSIDNGILSITARRADDTAGFSIPELQPLINDPIWDEFSTFHFDPNIPPSYPPTSPNELEYTSGIITSYDSFKFAKGYAEIRAKIPKGNGLWPAFWLLNGYYVGRQPEIDIMEARGENPKEIVHSYHLDNGLSSWSETTTHPNSVDGYSAAFHTYGVRWQAGKLEWYIDGELKHTYENDDVAYQVMYVIANLAVGGDFNYSDPVPSSFPISLDIDYIRIYQEKAIE